MRRTHGGSVVLRHHCWSCWRLLWEEEAKRKHAVTRLLG